MDSDSDNEMPDMVDSEMPDMVDSDMPDMIPSSSTTSIIQEFHLEATFSTPTPRQDPQQEDQQLQILHEIFNHPVRDCFLRSLSTDQFIDILLLWSNRTPDGSKLRSNISCQEVSFDYHNDSDIVFPSTSAILLHREDILEVLSFYQKLHPNNTATTQSTKDSFSTASYRTTNLIKTCLETWQPNNLSLTQDMWINLQQCYESISNQMPSPPLNEDQLLNEIGRLAKDVTSNLTRIQVLSQMLIESYEETAPDIESIITTALDPIRQTAAAKRIHAAKLKLDTVYDASLPLPPILSTFLFFYNGTIERLRYDMFSEIYRNGPHTERMLKLMVRCVVVTQNRWGWFSYAEETYSQINEIVKDEVLDKEKRKIAVTMSNGMLDCLFLHDTVWSLTETERTLWFHDTFVLVQQQDINFNDVSFLTGLNTGGKSLFSFALRGASKVLKEFSENVDPSKAAKQMCGYTFSAGDIVWSCRQCQKDDTCVMCHSCFQASHTIQDENGNYIPIQGKHLQIFI